MIADPVLQRVLNAEIHRRDSAHPFAPARPPAPAFFVGVQSGIGTKPDLELWTLTADIPGHPEGSTVSRETIEAAGYDMPEVRQ